MALVYEDFYKGARKDTPITIQKVADELVEQTLFSLLTRLIPSKRKAGPKKQMRPGKNVVQIIHNKNITKVLHVM